MIGPQWLSLLPPLATLVASIALKQVTLAMLIGIWSGALLLHGGNPLVAFLRTFDHYLVGAFLSAEHAGVVLFTLLLGGCIGLVQRSGGALGLAGLVQRFFDTRRKGLLSTIGLGSLVFFDDYSSILIVGNSLRPLVRRVKIATAKFAFVAHTVRAVPCDPVRAIVSAPGLGRLRRTPSPAATRQLLSAEAAAPRPSPGGRVYRLHVAHLLVGRYADRIHRRRL